jgi:4,5-DOPA dioxygenase extradiol
MIPDADVPVLQLSLPSASEPRELIELGRRLAPLRAEGVLLVASGGMVHDLGRLEWHAGDTPPARVPAWAREFEAWARAALDAGDLDQLAAFRERAPALRLAHPTEEHLLPLLVAAGAAEPAPGAARYPVEGFELGSLSKLCVELG